MLDSLAYIENFSIWIIGGDDNETRIVYRLIESIPVLVKKLQKGGITIWGRIENNSLPELLSRSSVVVMPSYREQFGMVAIEAMQCGCPVIAANTGGLQDIVISAKNGFLFERGNSMNLCAVLSGFLRNRPHQIYLRKQAKKWGRRFSQEHTFKAIKSIYEEDVLSVPNFWKDIPNKDQSSQIKNKFEQLMNEKITKYEVIHSHGKHHSLIVRTSSQTFFIKKVNEAPSCQASVFPIDFKHFINPKSSYERFLREIFHKEDPMSAKLFAYDIESRIIITEKLKPYEINFISETDCLRELIKSLKLFAPLNKTESCVINYVQILSEIKKHPSLELIDRFDRISSEINQKITGDLHSFTRTHCHVELYRLKFHLEKNTWILPQPCQLKFIGVINCLLESVEFSFDLPNIIHGDIKKGHFLKSPSGVLFCDWEHSKYCAGPLDEALLAFKIFIRADNPSIEKALKYLGQLLNDDKILFQQGVCWLIAQSIFASIFWSTQGNAEALNRGYDTLKDFNLIWHKDFT